MPLSGHWWGQGLHGDSRAGPHTQGSSHCPSQSQAAGGAGAAPGPGIGPPSGDGARPRPGRHVGLQGCGEMGTSPDWGLKWCPELWIGSGETQGSKQGLSGLLVPSGTGQPLIKQEQLHNSWTLRMHCVIYEHAIFFQVSPDAFWYFFVAFKLLAFPFTVEPFGCQSHFQPYFCLCSCLVSALSLAHPTSQFFQVKNCMEEATGYAQDVSFILCVIKKQYHIQAGTNLVILHFSP